MASGNFSFTFNEREYQDLQRILGDIADVDKRQAITNSLRRTTRNMVQGGKRNLASRNKKKTGHLSKSFKTTSSKKKVVAYAGFSRSGENKGNHAHLVDRGTVKRWTKKGYYRGSVSKSSPKTGTKFWTDSVMVQGQKGMQNLNNTIYQELAKITRRRSK
jgi:hypothetical protein